MSLITYLANFNGVELTSVTGLTVLTTNPYAPAKRKLTYNDLARTNKAKVNAAFYTKKTVVVRVGISRTTRDLAEASLDALNALLQGQEKPLILRQAGGNRKYTATYVDTVMRQEGAAYLEMDLVFETSDHFGYDPDYTLLVSAAGRTLYNYTDSFTIAGTADYQAPIIKITYTALTGGTNKNVTLKNPATGETLVINRTWAAGDLLVIDAQEGTVTVNGEDVEFTGPILLWAPGGGYLQITDEFATRTFTEFAYYYKRYV